MRFILQAVLCLILVLSVSSDLNFRFRSYNGVKYLSSRLHSIAHHVNEINPGWTVRLRSWYGYYIENYCICRTCFSFRLTFNLRAGITMEWNDWWVWEGVSDHLVFPHFTEPHWTRFPTRLTRASNGPGARVSPTFAIRAHAGAAGLTALSRPSQTASASRVAAAKRSRSPLRISSTVAPRVDTGT